MLAVIADDLTGAAEIAGICLRYGLNVELETEVLPTVNIDILVIAADSRASSVDQAREVIARISNELIDAGAELIFKKTDSVLRGHIIHELEEQMKVCNKSKALLIPANPSLNRTIENGIYRIENIPLSETGFADDPEFPLRSSNVLKILGESILYPTSIIKRGETVSEKGIMVGEAISVSDLKYWAEKIDKTIVPAGAAGFFRAFLESRGFKEQNKVKNPNYLPEGKSIFLCGSAFSSSRNLISKINGKRNIQCPMPDEVFYNSEGFDSAFLKWANEIIESIRKEGTVIISINQPVVQNTGFAKNLAESTAKIVQQVLKQTEVNDIFVEGGATTAALIKKMNFRSLKPVYEWSQGVIRMKVEDRPNLFITMKPGSYDWPKAIWNFN